MSKSYNYDQNRKSKVIKDTIETPIKHSFVEGLSISEYFNSSYGARKGMTDTAMKTSKSGYMTRKLVDATQEVIIQGYDCGTKTGLLVRDLINTKENSIIEPLSERILNRYCLADVLNPKTGEVIVKAGEMITSNIAKTIASSGVKEVVVRSPIHCSNVKGICQKCFGHDLSTNKLIEDGTAIGIVAAQSIGEPGTQLTMRTFHTGGVAGGSNITQGFERLKQLFDCVPPKSWEKSIISEISGKVSDIPSPANGYTLTVKSDIDERVYEIGMNKNINVAKGDIVYPGKRLTEGSIDVKELLNIAGIEAVRHYIIKEVQKVYRIQGIEISDKYVEIVVKQLTNKVKILIKTTFYWKSTILLI